MKPSQKKELELLTAGRAACGLAACVRGAERRGRMHSEVGRPVHVPSGGRDTHSPANLCNWESRSTALVGLELAVILLPQLPGFSGMAALERVSRVGVCERHSSRC